MEDVILCVLASCGVAMILWCMTGWALLPQRGRQVTILYASGDAMALEQRVRAQRWLRQSGLTGGRIILADCGLTAEAAERARRLCRENRIEYCRAEELSARLEAE